MMVTLDGITVNDLETRTVQPEDQFIGAEFEKATNALHARVIRSMYGTDWIKVWQRAKSTGMLTYTCSSWDDFTVCVLYAHTHTHTHTQAQGSPSSSSSSTITGVGKGKSGPAAPGDRNDHKETEMEMGPMPNADESV